ncbi:hypothetical protein AALA54_13890 [Oscillospiraceae bacterium 44-34]
MKDFEIVDLLPLHRQMTLVIFRDPNTQKCEVQILPVSPEMAELQNMQAMLKIPSEPRDDAATVSVEVDEILSRKIMDWCGSRGITPEQLVRAFICFCGESKNADILRAWIRQEAVRDKIDIEKLPSVTREELEQDIDAVMERVENGESPILIRSAGTTDLLLFGWEDYLRQFPTLYTPEEIAEIEAACLEIKETEVE